MNDDVYRKLAKVLDTLPSGFPATPEGLEIRILRKIFAPDEAELFCDLRLTPETAAQISARTGRPLEGLEEKLTQMGEKGEVMAIEFGGTKLFRMLPWVVGIFEFQLGRMDREFARMCEEYSPHFGREFMKYGPAIMQVIPIEKEIPAAQETLPYEQVSFILRNGQSFALNECICKKERGLLDNPCSKPTEVCMAIAPVPGVFDNGRHGRPISREEALGVLRKAEEAGLVHLTTNVQTGHWFICNCCACCCGVLKAIQLMGSNQPVNAHFRADIDPDRCVACGLCADTRCQVGAISQKQSGYRVDEKRCIGCGLCVTTCPSEAIHLLRRKPEEIIHPPKDDAAWMDERARQRGVDYSAHK